VVVSVVQAAIAIGKELANKPKPTQLKNSRRFIDAVISGLIFDYYLLLLCRGGRE
jgi:hypothetical protein